MCTAEKALSSPAFHLYMQLTVCCFACRRIKSGSIIDDRFSFTLKLTASRVSNTNYNILLDFIACLDQQQLELVKKRVSDAITGIILKVLLPPWIACLDPGKQWSSRAGPPEQK